MSEISDHELNQCLAEVAGVEIEWDQGMQFWYTKEPVNGEKPSPYAGVRYVWHALTDANQMQLVKVGLRKLVTEQGFHYEYSEYWDSYREIHDAHIEIREVDTDELLHEGQHENELHAFALAVWAMKKGE